MRAILKLKPVTLRRAMIWVAVFGLVLAALAMTFRRDEYKKIAAEHAWLARLQNEYAGRVAAVSPTFLRAARVANATGLPVALHADMTIGVAGLSKSSTTMILRPGGSEVSAVTEVSAETLKRFEDLSAAPEAEAQQYRSSTIKNAKALAHYHDRLRRKYNRAASRPWLTIEPDEPPR
jgi:hypothetical protein